MSERVFNKTTIEEVLECIDGGMSVDRAAKHLFVDPGRLRMVLCFLNISSHGQTGRGENRTTIEQARRNIADRLTQGRYP
jgi:hypothetical protein